MIFKAGTTPWETKPVIAIFTTEISGINFYHDYWNKTWYPGSDQMFYPDGFKLKLGQAASDSWIQVRWYAFKV